jgi:hypothetical protein
MPNHSRKQHALVAVPSRIGNMVYPHTSTQAIRTVKMPITKAVVTHDMKPEIYKIWKKLAELHGMDMDEYFEKLIKEQTYEASVMKYFHKRK